jgi:hypothetical protein
MRAWPVIFAIVLVASGCAPGKSRIGINSNKPVPVVASCIAEQWSRQYPNVRLAEYGRAPNLRANVGAVGLMDAQVYPTVYGSWVSLSTYHHEMLVRGHPVISGALACAQ